MPSKLIYNSVRAEKYKARGRVSIENRYMLVHSVLIQADCKGTHFYSQFKLLVLADAQI